MFMARCCLGMPKVYEPDFKTREALAPPKMNAVEMKAVRAGVPWNKIHIVAKEDATAAVVEAELAAAASPPGQLPRTVSVMPAADNVLLAELAAMAWPNGFRRNLARRALRACASSRCVYPAPAAPHHPAPPLIRMHPTVVLCGSASPLFGVPCLSSHAASPCSCWLPPPSTQH